ncbi:ribonuclease H-like domain-containing protein, partial [Tanacetum coccineum]
MTIDPPPPTPTLSLSDKLMTIHNLTTFVPVKLDIDEMNYADWVYYITDLCAGHGLLDHITTPPGTSSTTSTGLPEKDAEWLKLDFIIRTWITSTLSPTLQSRLVVLKPRTAKEAWDHLEEIFKDNKRPRAMALKTELRNLKLGDLTIDAYFRKLESIAFVLSGLGYPLTDEDIIHYALEGLPSTYQIMSTIIVSQNPFPDLKMVRSLLTTEEMRLKNRLQTTLVDPTSASPTVLLANTNNRRPPTSTDKVNKPCFLFNKGMCRFGEACKYLHNGVHGKASLSSPRNMVSSGMSSNASQSDIQALQLLLSKFGINCPLSSTVQLTHGTSHVGSLRRVLTLSMSQHGSQLAGQPTHGVHFIPGSQQGAQVGEVQPHGYLMSSIPPGFCPSVPSTGSGLQGQPTMLPHAFNTASIQDPLARTWNMDTGASSHLNDSVHCLSDIFNMCIYPSVAVGDGRFIPVTNSGHSILSTPFRPLRLNNVLITPNIVKNLISVRQFFCDNSCTVEFDSFGFSVKDFLTRRVLLRCDSTGDLYPVTKPSTIPQAFLTSQYTWHQRLGHPGSELGKHVKLPFVSSSSSVASSFDIIHSDIWTSLIPSLSGFQYYVLFLDHYSQYVWVYPLMHKSDVLSKFHLFRNYVRTQFKCEIKSFQCDHGGEFDNHAFHKLFNDNGIQFRFSCPRTSQQNGKSEPSSDLISTIIRTTPITPSPDPTPTPTADIPSTPIPPTPPSPPPSHTPQSEPSNVPTPQHIPEPTIAPANNPPTVSNHPMVTRSRVGTTRPNPRYAGHVSTISPLPRSYKEAFNDPNWRNAMYDEYNALITNKTWTSVPRPEGANIVRCTIPELSLAVAISRHWPFHQLDVKKSLFYMVIGQDGLIFISPPGFSGPEPPDHGVLLQRSLMVPINGTSGLGDDTAFLLLYVDDIVLTASSDRLLQQIISSLHREFSMTDLRKYAMEILERAHMVGCNPSWTPVDTKSKLGNSGTSVADPTLYRSLTGSLQYLTFTLPDITYAVQQ